MNRLLGCSFARSSLNDLKSKVAAKYIEAKTDILQRIIKGKVIHADETSANIRGHPVYVWVLSSLNEVIYLLVESREATFLKELLKDFSGVLISDFYAAYDAIECPQQKCLVHLIRDLNDEILNNPFDMEAKCIALRFAATMRSIVQTIDRHGLRKQFMERHATQVERFFGFLNGSSFESEAALKLAVRFRKNRNKLFTFLHYDDVPWNNNNAEHAIKAFARVRDLIGGLSTKQGLDDYLTLLSVSETCKYRKLDFLDFLRSGLNDIETFAASHGSRSNRRVPPKC